MQHHALIGLDSDGNERAIRLDYPDQWDELSRKQAIYAGNLMYLLSTQELSVDQFRKLMVDRFINRDNRGNDKLPSFENSMDMWGNEAQLADTVNFFFKIDKTEDGKERYELYPTGIMLLVPSFRKRCRKYRGPGKFLSGMSFIQFKDALTCASKYMETLDESWLTDLVAVLYLEKGKKYDPNNTHVREKRFASLNKGIKYMAFCYIMGCMNYLKHDGEGEGIEIDGVLCRFSYIFNKKDSAGSGESTGLTGVLMSLSESGVFGSIEKTANADVWDVLFRLYQLELENREMKRISKKNSDG